MVGAARRRKVAKEQRTVMKVDASGLLGGGPIVAYMSALMEGAEKKGEQVAVTKDVMKFRKIFESDKVYPDGTTFAEELQIIQNDYELSDVEKAEKMCELIGKMESTVFPKFIVFMSKKKRAGALSDVCTEYISSMYYNQSIAPVICTAAEPLTEEQEKSIKAKMQKKIGVKDIKLIVNLDSSLIAGFTLAWQLTDPEDITSATRGLDYSFKKVLGNAALSKGVVTTV